MFISKDPKSFLIRSANEVKSYRKLIIRLPIALAGIIVTVAVVYVVSLLYSKYGSFTVLVDGSDNIDYQLALCDDRNFNTRSSRLNARASEKVTCISVDDLPLDLDMIDGSHNGSNYIAYTFYLRNVGEKTLQSRYRLYIANTKQDLDKAIRIRLYVDGAPVTYARTRSDGKGAEEGCVDFIGKVDIAEEHLRVTAPGDTVKFTVVIWLEGDDPDCTDDLIGGGIKVGMTIRVALVDEDGDGIIDSPYEVSGEESSEATEPESTSAEPASLPEESSQPDTEDPV